MADDDDFDAGDDFNDDEPMDDLGELEAEEHDQDGERIELIDVSSDFYLWLSKLSWPDMMLISV